MGRVFLLVLVALFAVLGRPATAAARLRAKSAPQGDIVLYEARWEDGKATRSVSAPLPNGPLVADLRAPLRFPLAAASEAQAAAVRAWAKDGLPKGASVKVRTVKGGGVSYSVQARSRAAARAALAGAGEAASAELVRFAAAKGFIVDGDGAVLPDHAREALESADALRPLAEALAQGLPADDPRAFAARALHFTQAIPYEKRKSGADAGFRRPLSLLVKNKGDCDGKAVLFLGLMRARYPTLPMAVVLVPEHAFAAVELEPHSGERTIREDGVQYVILEPVGPARSDIGEPSKAGRRGMRWGRADLRPVPPQR